MNKLKLFLVSIALLATTAFSCSDGYDYRPGDTCEFASLDETSVRCYNPHGICYVYMPVVAQCTCNGDDDTEEQILCEEAKFYIGF